MPDVRLAGEEVMTTDGVVIVLIWAVAFLGLVVTWHLLKHLYDD